MTHQIPNRDALFEIACRFKDRNIQFALGGSGLLAFFGCSTEIHDWDITTDAPIDVVEQALDGLSFQRLGPTGIFATKYLFKITLMNTSIDIMGGFALKTRDGIFEVPTVVTAEWEGIPVGDPKIWVRVYEILNREEKANQLRDMLENSSL